MDGIGAGKGAFLLFTVAIHLFKGSPALSFARVRRVDSTAQRVGSQAPHPKRFGQEAPSLFCIEFHAVSQRMKKTMVPKAPPSGAWRIVLERRQKHRHQPHTFPARGGGWGEH